MIWQAMIRILRQNYLSRPIVGKGWSRRKNNLEEEKEESKDIKEKKVEEEKNKEEEYPESTAVFKVQSSEIIDKLTISKTKLLALRQKISPVDYAKINNYLLDENSTRGIIKTFGLLKAS